ncbi:GNAT family N-acetyltransferase [Peijinzhouia sedimentorum]
MNCKISEIKDKAELDAAFAIRYKVFVDEQKVPFDEECDEFEESSIHLIAKDNDGKALGTCRWRQTDKGIKMERFAVLKEARGKGVGARLVEACLASISSRPFTKGKKRYLNAQVSAIPLYEKFGFKEVDELFDECGIMHRQMERPDR